MTQMNATDRVRRLEGRHVMVTGAASGIGKATAQMFAAHGARLALVDANGPGVEAVAEETGGVAIAFDLTDTAHAEAMVNEGAGKMGGLDGLVNCAGLGSPRPIGQMDLGTVEKFAAINLIAPYMICKAALPHMQARGGGSIVNVASGQGLLPNAPDNTAYAATKGGLIAFSKSLAAEAAPRIRVNAVCPGVTLTGMTRFIFENYDDPSDAPFVQQYAMKRVAQPEELASAILFLISDESSYVTGSALAVDGGRCFH
jgi:NAD(P)-dependent dehydrogenase (short-subunit alcohol dehydrogenase family)